MVVGVVVDERDRVHRGAILEQHQSPEALVLPQLGVGGARDASLPGELDDLGGAVGALSGEAGGFWCEAFGQNDSGAVLEWRDVFGAQTEEGLAVNSEQWAGDLHPEGRFPECAEVAGEQDGAQLQRLIGWVEGGAVGHHDLAVGACHQEGFRVDAVHIQLRGEDDRHPVVAGDVKPTQYACYQRQLVEAVICGQDRGILGLTRVAVSI